MAILIGILVIVALIFLPSWLVNPYRYALGKLLGKEEKDPSDELYKRKFDLQKLKAELILLIHEKPLGKADLTPAALESCIRNDSGPVFWELHYELGFVRVLDEDVIVAIQQRRGDEESISEYLLGQKPLQHFRFRLSVDHSAGKLLFYSDFHDDGDVKEQKLKIVKLLSETLAL